MKKVKHTTVPLSENAQKIKMELTPVFGLKNILSAGLILFGKLTSDQQKQAIAESNGGEPITPPAGNRAQRIGELLEEFRTLTLSGEAPISKAASKKVAKKVVDH